MRLFTLDAEYNIVWEPQTILLEPFNKIFKRDKNKDKIKASKELAFVWFFVDIKSDYQIHTDETVRTDAIVSDLKLPKGWKIDPIIQDAIDFYTKMSTSVTSQILKDSMYVATKLSTKMVEAVDEEDTLDVGEITSLLEGVKKMPEVIKALQQAEKAVLKEIKETQDQTGSKEHALFENGL